MSNTYPEKTSCNRNAGFPKIVFMGTPEFAVESLQALIEEGYKVVGIVTMPDKPAGRGHKIQYSPVKQYALSQNIPILQPEKLKDAEFLKALNAWKADLQIVVAFRMLPEVVWNMPRLGTFNLHASLLPQYRGAAPINWAIIHGEKETGITTFFLTHEIDSGKIIAQEKIPIEETDNAGIIHDKLMRRGARLVIKTVDDIIHNSIKPIPQEIMVLSTPELKFAPKIFKETCCIDWNKNVHEIYDFVRGLSPHPCAWTELTFPKGDIIYFKIFEVEKIEKNSNFPVTTMVSDGKKYIDIRAKNGFIRLKSILPAGKKRMTTEEFLQGNANLFLNSDDEIKFIPNNKIT
jgi:methionyl-tRNA formyltransferase